jgi:hypothetical protein
MEQYITLLMSLFGNEKGTAYKIERMTMFNGMKVDEDAFCKNP